MGLDLGKFRKLVALDEDDPLSRFALGQALFQANDNESLNEAVEHLIFANNKDANHLATYHILGQALIKLGRIDEAKKILSVGCDKVNSGGGGMGKDLGPAMADMLSDIQ